MREPQLTTMMLMMMTNIQRFESRKLLLFSSNHNALSFILYNSLYSVSGVSPLPLMVACLMNCDGKLMSCNGGNGYQGNRIKCLSFINCSFSKTLMSSIILNKRSAFNYLSFDNFHSRDM